MNIISLHLYPIKSTLSYDVQQAVVLPRGLNFDRQFMLTDPNGKFITARKEGQLYHLSAYPLPNGLFVQHKTGAQLHINFSDFSQMQSCEVWGTEFASFVANDEINQWFSQFIGLPVQLRWLGQQSQRPLKRFPDQRLSFADGAPILLTSLGSLNKLQQHCASPIKMSQFRPNIVCDNVNAFSEQQWRKIQIGTVQFLHLKPSTRCILTTRDPDTNQLDPRAEPFRTLKKLNVNEKGEPVFGINLLPLSTGVIKLGDKISILE